MVLRYIGGPFILINSCYSIPLTACAISLFSCRIPCRRCTAFLAAMDISDLIPSPPFNCGTNVVLLVALMPTPVACLMAVPIMVSSLNNWSRLSTPSVAAYAVFCTAVDCIISIRCVDGLAIDCFMLVSLSFTASISSSAFCLHERSSEICTPRYLYGCELFRYGYVCVPLVGCV